MNTLADADEAVFVAARNPDSSDCFAGRAASGTSSAAGLVFEQRIILHPRERIQIPEAEVQRLAAAHRQTSELPARGLFHEY
jgi:hypothetical protein